MGSEEALPVFFTGFLSVSGLARLNPPKPELVSEYVDVPILAATSFVEAAEDAAVVAVAVSTYVFFTGKCPLLLCASSRRRALVSWVETLTL